MTFLEAAIEILRSAEEPLHFTEIARLAVERKLLSHVGRDPDAAMRSCLNSAVRSKVHDGLVMRSKPGHYRLRPGVAVPDLPPPPSEADPLPDAEPAPVDEPKSRSKSKAKKSSKSKKKAATRSKRSKKKTSSEAAEGEAGEGEGEAEPKPKPKPKPKKISKKTSKKTGKKSSKKARGKKKSSKRGRDEDEDGAAEEQDEAESPQQTDAMAAAAEYVGDGTVVPMAKLDPSKVRFRGPEGSGLEGETDIALVMANAMSRLVEERPELREELEAMQKGQAPPPEVIEVGRKKRRDDDQKSERGDRDEDRGGRRRRRRRRRSRRVDWSESGAQRTELTRGEELLDKVAAVLAEAGTRSLHVRQIAESLAAQDVLGGEISEIERAVTAAVLLDVHRRGDASRFCVRGDARYQLKGSRVPEKAGAAEQALRSAARRCETEIETQLLLWLQSLGARSLESLVRIWLASERYALVATLPPSRGLGKLVVEDPDPEEDDGRTLVLIVPRKTSLEPKLWDGEAERNNCSSTMVFAMCEPISDQAIGDTRVVFAREMSRWLLEQGIGVKTLKIEVPVLDADLIESIGGLDT